MLVFDCPECGKQNTVNAARCSHCGFPTAIETGRTMARMGLLFAVIVVGCLIIAALKPAIKGDGAILGMIPIGGAIVVTIIDSRTEKRKKQERAMIWDTARRSARKQEDSEGR